MIGAITQPFYQKGLFITLFFICLYTSFFDCLAQGLDEQKIFLKAEQAIKLDKVELVNDYLPHLKTFPLYNYLEYQRLKKELTHNQNNQSVFYKQPINHSHISQYCQRYSDSVLSKSLIHLWLTHHAKKGQWDDFLKALPPREALEGNIALQCHTLYAHYQAFPIKSTLIPALKLWKAHPSAPLECEALFNLLYQADLITQEHLLNNYQLLLEKRTPTALKLAKTLSLKMNPEYQKIASIWQTLISHPEKLSDSEFLKNLTLHKNKILVSSFKQYAKYHPLKAKIDFEEKVMKFSFNERDIADMRKQIAMSLALHHDKQALTWFKKIPCHYLDKKSYDWYIRSALQQKNWTVVLEGITYLETQGPLDENWQYWKARALEKLDLPGSLPLYQKLSSKRSFYGFLAAERLHQSVHLNHYPHPEAPKAVTELEKTRMVRRVKALFSLNRPHEAQREWYYMVSLMNDFEKTHAARLAKRLNWHHLAIYTFNQSKHKDDVIVRFPLAFENLILIQAQSYKMDSAWLFAIARQESNFNPLAHSPVGARGLMQLMPKTAHSIDKTKSQFLSSPDINIHLGTHYLKSLYLHTQHPVIATASYNAGPSRVKKWLPIEPCESDIWIEIIPFEETRNYVKNVLTLTCIYKHLQNQPFALSHIMPPVRA